MKSLIADSPFPTINAFSISQCSGSSISGSRQVTGREDPASIGTFRRFDAATIQCAFSKLWERQIEAFRRFQIPDELIEKHKYRPLGREVKAQIFGLNAARVFRVDARAKRNELPKDYLSRIKIAHLEEGSEPGHRWYGRIAG